MTAIALPFLLALLQSPPEGGAPAGKPPAQAAPPQPGAQEAKPPAAQPRPAWQDF